MNRERAKKLLPIIQAYAEGKQIQCRFVDHEDWHDVDDNDGIIVGSRYEYRIKPSEKYNEIFKLKSLLEENHIPFEWIEHNDFRNGYQICYPVKSEKRVCSVIEHSFSYGSQKDLLEIQGLLTAEEEEEEYDSVLGNLTADNVFQRILSHWEKINSVKPEELKCLEKFDIILWDEPLHMHEAIARVRVAEAGLHRRFERVRLAGTITDWFSYQKTKGALRKGEKLAIWRLSWREIKKLLENS